jgi:hypothetical protein
MAVRIIQKVPFSCASSREFSSSAFMFLIWIYNVAKMMPEKSSLLARIFWFQYGTWFHFGTNSCDMSMHSISSESNIPEFLKARLIARYRLTAGLLE